MTSRTCDGAFGRAVDAARPPRPAVDEHAHAVLAGRVDHVHCRALRPAAGEQRLLGRGRRERHRARARAQCGCGSARIDARPSGPATALTRVRYASPPAPSSPGAARHVVAGEEPHLRGRPREALERLAQHGELPRALGGQRHVGQLAPAHSPGPASGHGGRHAVGRRLVDLHGVGAPELGVGRRRR